MNVDDAMSIFDGVMLSDGGISALRYYTREKFAISQSGVQHTDWLKHIAEAMIILGVPVVDGCPKQGNYVSKGKEYICLYLQSKPCSFISFERSRWYPEGTKKVPCDIRINPVSVAHWFMGDGSSSYFQGEYVEAKFSTDAFSLEDNTLLCLMLAKLGITSSKPKYHHSIGISSMKSVIMLMEMIEPYILPSFVYKVKYPTGRK
jgi:hypothetical protein